LVDLYAIESLLAVLGPVALDSGAIDSENFFASLSRTVADVDRHDEESLADRKSLLGELGNRLFTQKIRAFWRWPFLTHRISSLIEENHIFVPGLSPGLETRPSDFAVIEWNLGGGKSSRYLNKKIQITGRETLDGKWDFQIVFQAQHLGGFETPLSQVWKGVFEFRFPGQDPQMIEAAISPGERWDRTFTLEGLDFQSSEGSSFSIVSPRSQPLYYDLALTSGSQRSFERTSQSVRENLLQSRGTLNGESKLIAWQMVDDATRPFVSLHEVVGMDSLRPDLQSFFREKIGEEPNPILVEVHFNEAVRLLDSFSIKLRDRDYARPEISENPALLNHKFLNDQRTLLLAFSQNAVQLDERFYLEITGIEDLSGNRLGAGQRTIITR
jgi:hypothetical protein